MPLVHRTWLNHCFHQRSNCIPVIFSSTGRRPSSYCHGVVSRHSVRPSVCSSVHVCIRKLFLKKTSQKVLTGFLQNFTGMFCRWSFFKFLQIIVFFEEFWLPCKKTFKYFSQTTNWIALLFCRNVSKIEVYRIPLNKNDPSKNIGFIGDSFSFYYAIQ